MTHNVVLVLGDEEPGVKCAVKNSRQGVQQVDDTPRIGETLIYASVTYEIVCVVHDYDVRSPNIYVYGVRK